MSLTDYHFVFVHGYTSSSKGDWYPAMAALLDRRGVSYSMPDLPGKDRPKVSQWLPMIDREVQGAAKPVVLVGQSLGTRAVMLYLHEHPEISVHAVFLVATFNNDVAANRFKRGEGYANFWEYPVDTKQLKRQADRWVVLHAYDDKNIDYRQAEDISRQLSAKLKLSRGQAHFNDPKLAGYVLRQLGDGLNTRSGKLRSWLGKIFGL